MSSAKRSRWNTCAAWIAANLSSTSSTTTPKCIFRNGAVAIGRAEIEKLFGDLSSIVSRIQHHSAYFNVIQQGDLVVVEGTTHGTTATGVDWRAGVTHAGRWCDVFEIRDFKIQRCYVYLDPDYASADTERYPWLRNEADRKA